MKVEVGDIKKLRQKTGAGIADCRRALEEAKGDFKKASELIKNWGVEIASKKSERAVSAGRIETYIHGDGKVGAMVEVACETDFVAKNDVFKDLAHEIAMQVAAMEPKDIEELLKQEYIRDASKKIEDLVTEAVTKLGENIVIKRFIRFKLGK
ncbi:translation elongation factor Ts [Candidatus Curtissbacteria bacterium RBG_13_35_7]|uniref:Elongation factor Ts n=1 Tax=Candidatus Curtissbacteria bacterium RBG_13_35_7 TaxID=1797705 RepID=A0A1F5G314_9BACT|nr:MAG: translation elongation factor Ts [Candidatus Curtissbacteria bacterium RBG_13_35_7]